jgi:hypothetical protein
MTPSPFSATSTWTGMLDHKEWQSLYIPKSATSGVGLINTIAGLNTAWPPKDPLIVDVMRQIGVIGRGLDGFMSRMMPAMDVIGRHLTGIAEFTGRIDWETIVESWRVQEPRRPRTKIGFATLDAYDALYMGHPWVADRFLIEYLGIKPSDETREALWIVLREAFERTDPEPATWILLDDEQARRYLRCAVWNEVGRIRRDREMKDRIWWPEGEKEEDEGGVKLSKPALSENNTLEFIVRKSPGPDRLLILHQIPGVKFSSCSTSRAQSRTRRSWRCSSPASTCRASQRSSAGRRCWRSCARRSGGGESSSIHRRMASNRPDAPLLKVHGYQGSHNDDGPGGAPDNPGAPRDL